jgi:hypothetical protein
MLEHLFTEKDIETINIFLSKVKEIENKKEPDIYHLESLLINMENYFKQMKEQSLEHSDNYILYNTYLIRVNDTKEREFFDAKISYKNIYNRGKMIKKNYDDYLKSYYKVFKQIKFDFIMIK